MTGRVGRMLAVGPAVLLAAWLVSGLPLLLLDALHPTPSILLSAALAVPMLWCLWRLTPQESGSDATPVVATLLTLAVAAGFAALAWTTSAQDVIVRRDPAVYALTADWLADRGQLPIPAQSEVFDYADRLEYQSPAFYQREDPPVLVPQFMTGTAIAFTPAAWLDGLRGATRSNAVVGALALLAVAGLAARFVGAWAAPPTALVLAFVFPQLHVARAAFSELPAQLLLFGGLCLLVEARTAARTRTSLAAHGLAGLLIGLVTLVRIDALVDLIPMIVVVAVLAVGRRIEGLALAGGLFAGLTFGLVDGALVTKPYLEMLSSELRLVTTAAVVAAALVILGTAWRSSLARIPHVAGAAAAAVMGLAALAYIVRPWVHEPKFADDDPIGRAVVALQARLGLPPDGPRTYAEHSMQWLGWWVGPIGLALGVVGLALLLRRVIRNPQDVTLPFVLVGLLATAVLVAKPSITPDHPWADRRFVPVVLPALVIGAIWVIAQLARRNRVVGGAALLALLVPTIIASAPLLDERTHRGVLAAVNGVCDQLPDRAAVVLSGPPARSEWPQVLRGQCGVPVGIAPGADPTPVVAAAAAGARANGFHPVLLADTATAATNVGGVRVRQVLDLDTTDADRQLVRRPTGSAPHLRELWLAELP